MSFFFLQRIFILFNFALYRIAKNFAIQQEGFRGRIFTLSISLSFVGPAHDLSK